MKHFVSSWSGGKDSCLAFMRAKREGMVPVALLNMMNENGKVSRSHAIPKEILERQAQCLDLPIETQPASWESYEDVFIKALQGLKKNYTIDAAVYGDIDLQAHRDWEEKVSGVAGLEAILPLWQEDRKGLVLEILDSGVEAYIVSCNERMGEHFLGQKITHGLIDELERIGVDVCGENGEYHTLVVDAPVFKNRIAVGFGQTSNYRNYWFIEMGLEAEPPLGL